MGTLDRPCPVCDGAMMRTHDGLILRKNRVSYFRCGECDYWSTEHPYWLAEAYEEPIAALDTGIVLRNLWASDVVRRILNILGMSRGTFVDWAGGYGLLTRRMRDIGYDFLWHDPFTENLFARGFEWRRRANVITPVLACTAIEVLEHVHDPLNFLQVMMDETGAQTIIFSQEICTTSTDTNWWYFMPETGQHISFYTRKTLRTIATRLGLRLYEYRGMFILTRRRSFRLRASNTWWRFSRRLLRASRISRFAGSLTASDFQTLLRLRDAIG